MERGQSIRQRVGNAIVALQIGDATHQRLEHVGLGLRLLLVETGTVASGESDSVRDDAVVPSICPVLSAQLSDAAEELDRDMRRVGTALDSLVEDARSLRELGILTYGSSGQSDVAFIRELEDQVRQASAILERFGATREETSQVFGSVSDATASLAQHLATVRSLEADIRIMGLNATLKCARVGSEGRALGVVAQELRAYANLFATEADALMGEVRGIASASGSLTQKDRELDPIAGIAETMVAALSVFREVGAGLERTLRELDSDGGQVVHLLEEGLASLRAREEICAALGRATEGFADLMRSHRGGQRGGCARLSDGAERIAAATEHSYTMERERLVHHRFFGATKPRSLSGSRPATASLDDALF